MFLGHKGGLGLEWEVGMVADPRNRSDRWEIPPSARWVVGYGRNTVGINPNPPLVP